MVIVMVIVSSISKHNSNGIIINLIKVIIVIIISLITLIGDTITITTNINIRSDN